MSLQVSMFTLQTIPVFLPFTLFSGYGHFVLKLQVKSIVFYADQILIFCVMRETRSYSKAAKRSLRSLSKEPVREQKLERKKSNKKRPEKRRVKVNEPPRQCNSCFEMVDRSFQLPCNHLFCKGCVRGLFVAALADQSLLPVKCCGKRVDQRLRRAILTLAECDQFEASLGELEATNKLYW